MMLKFFKSIFILFFLISPSLSSAGMMGDEEAVTSILVSLDFGAQDSFGFNTMYVDNGSDMLPPFNVDKFTTGNKTRGIFGFTLGYRWCCENEWLPGYLLGLRYERVFPANVGNRVIEPNWPLFNNYTYSWKMAANALFLTGKVDVYNFNNFMPYFNASVGMAGIRTKKFSEVPLAGITPRIDPAFGKNHENNFAYTAGIGVDYTIDQFILSLGYEFQSLGSFQSGFGVDTWSDRFLSQNAYKANTLLLSAAYLFDC